MHDARLARRHQVAGRRGVLPQRLAEENAAEFIRTHANKPVAAFVAGTTANWPDGKVDPDPGAQARRCFTKPQSQLFKGSTRCYSWFNRFDFAHTSQNTFASARTYRVIKGTFIKLVVASAQSGECSEGSIGFRRVFCDIAVIDFRIQRLQ